MSADISSQSFISLTLKDLQKKLRGLESALPSHERNAEIVKLSRELRKISAVNRQIARKAREASMARRSHSYSAGAELMVAAGATH